jgi:hypothetical protein
MASCRIFALRRAKYRVVVSAPLAAIAHGRRGRAARRPPPQRRRRAIPCARTLDDLHRRRDDKAAWSEEQRLVQSLIARAPGDTGAVARGAVLLLGQRRPGVAKEQRSRWGKDGWDFAETRDRRQPNDVAGYYWAALCMGNYALGLGVVKALSQGWRASSATG